MKVALFKRTILRKKIKVEALERKMGDEDAILASQQFLIPFVATILGTLTGVAGLLLAVRPLMPEGFFWQCAIIVAILGATLIGVFRFYKWAVKHMLTEKQRSALETKYNFEF